MFAAAVVGFKNSGKTTLCEQIGQALKGLNVKAAAIKCSHHDQLDAPSTDTGRLALVYETVGAVLPDKAAMFWNKKRYIPDLIPIMEAQGLIVEGGKSLGWLPRILVLRSPEEAEELDKGLALCTFGEITSPGVPAVTDIEELTKLVMERGFALPGLDCGDCGREDCASLARDIVAGKATPDACRSRTPSCSIKVNGVPLGMNHFVKDIISSGILGMLKELKGFAPGTVEISIENKS